jgi:hypothetical protein
MPEEMAFLPLPHHTGHVTVTPCSSLQVLAGPLRVPCGSLAGQSRCGKRQTRQFWTPIRQLGGGGTSLGSHLAAPPPPPTEEIVVFCLFLLNYMTSARYFSCYFLLLIQPVVGRKSPK